MTMNSENYCVFIQTGLTGHVAFMLMKCEGQMQGIATLCDSVCARTRVYVCARVCESARAPLMCVRVCMRVWLCACARVYVGACMYMCKCTSVCVCACTCICVCVFV